MFHASEMGNEKGRHDARWGLCRGRWVIEVWSCHWTSAKTLSPLFPSIIQSIQPEPTPPKLSRRGHHHKIKMKCSNAQLHFGCLPNCTQSSFSFDLSLGPEQWGCKETIGELKNSQNLAQALVVRGENFYILWDFCIFSELFLYFFAIYRGQSYPNTLEICYFSQLIKKDLNN